MDFFARQEAARRTTRWLLVAFLISVALVVVAVDAVVVFVIGAAEPGTSPVNAVVGSSVVVLGHHLRRQPLQDSLVARRRRRGGAFAGRHAHRAQHGRHRAQAPAQRRRGDVHRFGRHHARGVRARKRRRHQRLRGGQFAGRCRHRRDARRRHAPQARGTAGRGGARIQPHPQRRHAPQPALVRLDVRLLAVAIVARIVLHSSPHVEPAAAARTARARSCSRRWRRWCWVTSACSSGACCRRPCRGIASASPMRRPCSSRAIPRGLSGALLKIAGASAGSRLVTPEAEEVAHMLFAAGLPRLFATHPPIEERLKALDPSFNARRICRRWRPRPRATAERQRARRRTSRTPRYPARRRERRRIHAGAAIAAFAAHAAARHRGAGRHHRQ